MVDNIVSIMIEQHRGLQKDLDEVVNQFQEGNPDISKIDKSLKKFNKDLKEHLELENNVFYKQLLEKMKLKGQDTEKTELFIGQMKEIEKSVYAFLEKYESPDKIENKINKFKEELDDIINTLNLRIESEESGVYSYWALF